MLFQAYRLVLCFKTLLLEMFVRLSDMKPLFLLLALALSFFSHHNFFGLVQLAVGSC